MNFIRLLAPDTTRPVFEFVAPSSFHFGEQKILILDILDKPLEQVFSASLVHDKDWLTDPTR